MEAFRDRRNCLNHSRTIIFVQTDILQSFLGTRFVPAVLKFEKGIVACNQIARRMGIFEQMTVATASMIYPSLHIMDATDHVLECKIPLDRTSNLLLSYAQILERISLDQCFIDLSSHPAVLNAVDSPMEQQTSNCSCGYSSRLKAGRGLASNIQTTLRTNFNLSCRIGVSYSKTMARIAAERCALGECFSVSPEEAADVLPNAHARLLFPETAIPLLLRKGIRTVKDVRGINFETLKDWVGTTCAVHIRNAAVDIDSSAVVRCDRWLRFSVESEIREKFRVLLFRLLCLLEGTSRPPLAIKVTVRKFDQTRNITFKETQTGTIPNGVMMGRNSPETIPKLLAVVMSLFHRVVDVSRSFHLALLGLGFVRFEELGSVRSVASCLLRKRELSVQSVVSISFEGEANYLPVNSRQRTPEPSDFIEELGPSEKRAKLDIVIKKRKFHEDMDTCSPSKLKVGDLNINGDDGSTNGHNFIHC